MNYNTVLEWLKNTARLKEPFRPSPGINPIKYAWDMLSRAVRTRRNPSRNLQELVVGDMEEWIFPYLQEVIVSLVTSMRRRPQACIRGRNTHH